MGRIVQVKEGQNYGDRGDLTLSDGHTVQYADDVTELYARHLHFLSTNVTSINLIKNNCLLQSSLFETSTDSDFFLKRFYLFTFREKRRKGERKRTRETSVCKRHPTPNWGTCPATQAGVPTGN